MAAKNIAILSLGGNNDLDSALTLLPSVKKDTLLGPRMLTQSEINWMRRNKAAAAQKMAQIISGMKEQLQPKPQPQTGWQTA